MSKRIVVDPVTRIEGHLRIEAEVKDGKIVDAWSAGTMVRGLEIILQGRDPRDAWALTGRVCGVCTSMHSLVSVRAVEKALSIDIPPNAELIRNLMFASIYLQDHVVHFYHLHALDWVDIVSALSADPKESSAIQKAISNWPKSSPKYFADVQNKVKKFVASGQLGIFANGYWGHKAFKLPPAVNLLAVAHYLEALEWQKEVVKVQTIFGGKHPHPNYVVGGMPCAINLDEVNAINMERLNHVHQLLKDASDFVNQVYIPDLLAIAPYYKDWAAIGGGVQNYLAYGDMPLGSYNDSSGLRLPRGVILNRNLGEVHPVDADNPQEITEEVTNSWYSYAGGDSKSLHPFDGETKFNYTGPQPPYENLDVEGKYSWIKTPRWKGHPMEVGPLSRMLVGYASGSTEIKDVVNMALGKLGVGAGALFSTLGRTAARGLESVLVAKWALDDYDKLIANLKAGDDRVHNSSKFKPETWPKEAKGFGLSEAPRGALAHFVKIRNKKIDNYQLVVPTTWNASPRDSKGQRSAFEESLIGTPVENIEQPLELIRTIHSFDPCLACAVHLYDEKGDCKHQLNTF
ncbi:MAG: nickel-dependent hydrogenase large subunit [Proteobacteria bacterium]|nr:nickel-dependent hydrogenase large subunit [Pseudomonadota bacterium]